MVDYVKSRARLVRQLSENIRDRRVMLAMSRVPREKFVPPEMRHQAYEDIPLPIGWQQTISQPYIIAMMTEALELKLEDTVLEIGTGSGYQTAILAELASRVITVERVKALSESARRLLGDLGYTNIEFHLAEETLGWKRDAPYDAILVTAGAPSVPADLVDQLRVGGRLVIPVGARYLQELCQLTKGPQGNVVRKMGGCRFVSLIGKNAWSH